MALQVQSSGLPSIFLTAQPQPTFYLSSKTFQGLLTLQGFYPSMTTFLAAFFLASSSPQKEFSRTKMAIGVFYSQVFLKKFNAPMSKTKTKTNKPKKPQGFARFWEACVTEWWTPRILGSGGPGFKPRPPRCFLDNKLYSTLFLFTQVYKWVPVTHCWGRGGVTLRYTSILSRGE